MENSRREIHQLWINYTTKNEEIYFREFIRGFVEIWETKLPLHWNYEFYNTDTFNEDIGPHLSRLPEELLPAIGKFLFIAKENAESGRLTCDYLEETQYLIRCLISLSRNSNNISQLVDYVKLVIAISQAIISRNDMREDEISCFIYSCYFLEGLYDPYLTWRYFKHRKKLPGKYYELYYNSPSAVINMEIIPFIYSCFDLQLKGPCQKIYEELLNLLAAVMLGSPGNSIQSIGPATSNLLRSIICNLDISVNVKLCAVKCVIAMINSLLLIQPHQRQIEINTLIGMYKECMTKMKWTDNSELILELIEMLRCLVDIIQKDDYRVKLIMAQNSILDTILEILEYVQVTDELAYESAETLAVIIKSQDFCKERMTKINGYNRLFRRIRLIDIDYKLLRSLVNILIEDDCVEYRNIQLKNGQMVLPLLEVIPSLPCDDQNWVLTCIFEACTCSHRCKLTALELNVVMGICNCLSKYSTLSHSVIQMLIRLLESLICVSIKTSDLKSILTLFQDDQFNLTCLSSDLLSCLCRVSNITELTICNRYLDIQRYSDGLTVPNINKWCGDMFGLTFQCWFSLNDVASDSIERRQLLTLACINQICLEVFICNPDNTLILCINTKREMIAIIPSNNNVINRNKWYCLQLTYTPSKGPFRNNQISICLNGECIATTNTKLPSFTEAFTWCTIGAPIEDTAFKNLFIPSTQTTTDRRLLSSIMSQVPNYITLPLRGASSINSLVKNFPTGSQDTLYGQSVPLDGFVGSCAMFHDALPTHILNSIYEAGPNWVFSEESSISLGINGKIVFLYCPAASIFGKIVDVAGKFKIDAQSTARIHQVKLLSKAIVSIGGVESLLPLLEMPEFVNEENNWSPLFEYPGNMEETMVVENPVAVFLTLLTNLLENENNQEMFLKKNGFAILGRLLSKISLNFLDESVLKCAFRLVDTGKGSNVDKLLDSIVKNVIFNMDIWTRRDYVYINGYFEMIQTMIKIDRKYCRKKYGVQFFLDVIRKYFCGCDNLNSEQRNLIRASIFDIVKYYIMKDINVKETSAIIRFLITVTEECVIVQLVSMLIARMESKSCTDQIFLLFYEPKRAELLYALLTVHYFSMECKQVILKLISILLRSDRVYDKSKTILRLQDASAFGMYPGLVSLFPHAPKFSMEVALMLLDQILLVETSDGYAGALTLIEALSLVDIDIKLETARKVLAVIFMKPTAPSIFAKQIGWQNCITKLLIDHPISGDDESIFPDLISFDEEKFEDNYESSSNDAASFLLGVADSMTQNIQYAAGNLSSVVTQYATAGVSLVTDSVSSAVSDNLNLASQGLTSAVNSAYSMLGIPSFELNVKNLTEEETASICEGDVSPGLSSRCTSKASLDDILDNNRPGSSLSERSQSIKSKDTQSIASGEINQDDNNAEDDPTIDMLRQWKILEKENTIDKEGELCYLVTNILFTIMWRGYEDQHVNPWKERGQVMASIILIGLNNALCCSHLQIKLQIMEMMVHAALTDILDASNNSNTKDDRVNVTHLIEWVYDLAVLDPNPDESKKISVQLMDSVLGLLDSLNVFREDPSEEDSHMFRMSLGILMKCISNSNLELCAMACAKLNAIIRLRDINDVMEISYMIYGINEVITENVKDENKEHYVFVIPVMKALITKCENFPEIVGKIPTYLVGHTGSEFHSSFLKIILQVEWTEFIDNEVKPHYQNYKTNMLSGLTEKMNVFWAECYEQCKESQYKRNKLVAESQLRFQNAILKPYRYEKAKENARYNAMLNQQRSYKIMTKKNWESEKRILLGPRGYWKTRHQETYWKLSRRENFSRMRLKLVPNVNFNSHKDASELRDNTGWVRSPRNSEDNMPFNFKISEAAVKDDDDSINEQLFVQEESKESEENENPLQGSNNVKERLMISCECELVTMMSVIKGRLDVTSANLCFHDLSPAKEDSKRHDFKFPSSKLRDLFLKRYNLRRTAIEIFLTDQTNYFINFTKQTRNSVLSAILKTRPPNLSYQNYRTPADLLRVSGLTQKWVNHEITNFDYLMQLNTMAGRSYNDLSQYPVFPWILADYTSNELDLTNPATFRDLSKPIGVVNPDNELEVRTKYNTFEDPLGIISKFHYGTHYSNSAGVLHYLVRVEPFTSLHIELQSGRFDVADRQFHSIPQTWKLLMENPNDVKELIPEFFYLPEFLKNLNNFDLGTLQSSKERVDDVELPSWASSAEDFIYKHRKALECEYVSNHLHEWIDLIFGYKQKGPNAVEALNVFYYCSYEGAVDLDAIDDPVEREAVEGMINNFGQTPSQLLKEPHPRRLSSNEALQRIVKCEFRKPDFTLFLDHLLKFNIDISTDRDPVIFISAPRSSPKGFLQITPSDIVTVSKNGYVGVHGWSDKDRNSPSGFSLDLDATLNSSRWRRDISDSLHAGIPINSKLIVVSHDCKYLFVGGNWDCSFKVYNLSKNRFISSVVKHDDIVTCLHTDSCGWYLITGSNDCTSIIWDITNVNKPVAYQVLHGHDEKITCVVLSTELDVAASGSIDGLVNVYSIHKGQLIRTLNSVGCELTSFQITYLTLSSYGHVAFSGYDKLNNSIHVFSINGHHLGSKYVLGQVTGLITANDCLIVTDDAGDLTINRLLGLHAVYNIPLHIPIQTVAATIGNSNLLAPLGDGTLAIITIPNNII